MYLSLRFHHLLLSIALLSAHSVSAGISLDNTRIIFNADDNKSAANIQINNSQDSDSPYLIKTQVTQDINGQKTDVPFITTPNLFRLEPGNSNQVRIISKPHTLPEDRESIFYFRAIAMPPQSSKENGDKHILEGGIQLASGNVIKLFYRPAGLVIASDKAAGKLLFSATKTGIKVTNPTPYYITLVSLEIEGKAVNIRTTAGRNMVPPLSDRLFPSSRKQGSVQWQVINDYGGEDIFNGKIQ